MFELEIHNALVTLLIRAIRTGGAGMGPRRTGGDIHVGVYRSGRGKCALYPGMVGFDSPKFVKVCEDGSMCFAGFVYVTDVDLLFGYLLFCTCAFLWILLF